MPLTRDAILAAKDCPVQAFPVPEWGGEVCLRPMSGAQREEFDARFVKEAKGMRLYLLAASICDEKGAPLFAEADLEALGAKSGAVLDRIAKAALRVNGLVSAEESEKNS